MDATIISFVFVALFLGSAYLGIYVTAGLGRRIERLDTRLYLAEQRELIHSERNARSAFLLQEVLNERALSPRLHDEVKGHVEEINKPVEVKRVVHLAADPVAA